MTVSAYPTLDEAVHAFGELRPLGTVTARVIDLTAGEHFSAHELATVISSDQALTARVLRLANSAYYGFPRRITTVREAVVLLGFRQVRSAALAACMVEFVPTSNHLNYRDFWQFSVTVAMLSEVLARIEAIPQEEAFTAGLLHNIGRLALDQQLPTALAEAIRHSQREGISLSDAERAILGYTDRELGGALALHWNFPPSLAEAVAKHNIETNDAQARHSLAGCVSRARSFLQTQGLQDGIEQVARRDPPLEWTTPPLSVALQRSGGVDGLLERVEAFLQSVIAD